MRGPLKHPFPSIEDAFEHFVEADLPRGTSEQALKYMRSAFYAGAVSGYSMGVETCRGDDPAKAAARFAAEVREFTKRG